MYIVCADTLPTLRRIENAVFYCVLAKNTHPEYDSNSLVVVTIGLKDRRWG